MTNVYTSTVVPAELQWWGWGREATAGTAVQPVLSMPLEKGTPDDKPTILIDKGLRGFMGEDYSIEVGTEIADFPMSGDVYLDSIGFPLHNLFGDYQASGTASSSPALAGTITTTNPPAGTTALTLSADTGLVGNTTYAIQLGTTGAAGTEVVTFTTPGTVTTSITLNAPTRFNHVTGVAFTLVVAPFTHNFALLNGNGTLGQNIDAQPVTHTITYHNNLAASTLARQYPYWCCSGIDFKLNSEQLFQHDTKGTSVIGGDAATAPTNGQSGSVANADWQFAVGIGGPASGGTLVNNVTDATLSYERGLKPEFGLNGQQAPYVIARLGLTVTGKLTFIAQDETPLTALLNGTVQQLQLKMSNNLGPGGTAQGITFNFQHAQYEASPIQAPDVLMWDVSFRGLMNNTDVGSTGGLGPSSVTLVNAQPTY